MIRWACKRYGLKLMPTVKQHDGGSYAWSFTPDDDTLRPAISIQARTQKNTPTALHEAAHVVADRIFEGDAQNHGPEFLGVYMALLIDAEVAPAAALHATALEHKLKWLPYEQIGPTAIRARRSS